MYKWNVAYFASEEWTLGLDGELLIATADPVKLGAQRYTLSFISILISHSARFQTYNIFKPEDAKQSVVFVTNEYV